MKRIKVWPHVITPGTHGEPVEVDVPDAAYAMAEELLSGVAFSCGCCGADEQDTLTAIVAYNISTKDRIDALVTGMLAEYLR